MDWSFESDTLNDGLSERCYWSLPQVLVRAR